MVNLWHMCHKWHTMSFLATPPRGRTGMRCALVRPLKPLEVVWEGPSLTWSLEPPKIMREWGVIFYSFWRRQGHAKAFSKIFKSHLTRSSWRQKVFFSPDSQRQIKIFTTMYLLNVLCHPSHYAKWLLLWTVSLLLGWVEERRVTHQQTQIRHFLNFLTCWAQNVHQHWLSIMGMNPWKDGSFISHAWAS